MPRIDDDQFYLELQDSMTVPVSGNGQRQLSPQTLQSLIQKAREKRGGTIPPKAKPKAKGII